MSNKFKPGDKVVLAVAFTPGDEQWLYQILTIKGFYNGDSWCVEETDRLFGTYQLMTEKQYNFLDELENLLNEHNAELKVFNKLRGGEIRSVVAAYVDKEPMFILEDFV
jgi:hypothetical protein